MTFSRPTIAQRQEQRAAERAANLKALATIPARSLHRATYSGGTAQAVPKSEPKRNAVLLEMVRGRPCLLLVPGIGTHDPQTVVAAHSNSLRHGKAKARKADDQFSCAACARCHEWLDTGPASADEKESVFADGHARQVWVWQNIAASAAEPERFRKAAQWALHQLGAMP